MGPGSEPLWSPQDQTLGSHLRSAEPFVLFPPQGPHHSPSHRGGDTGLSMVIPVTAGGRASGQLIRITPAMGRSLGVSLLQWIQLHKERRPQDENRAGPAGGLLGGWRMCSPRKSWAHVDPRLWASVALRMDQVTESEWSTWHPAGAGSQWWEGGSILLRLSGTGPLGLLWTPRRQVGFSNDQLFDHHPSAFRRSWGFLS